MRLPSRPRDLAGPFAITGEKGAFLFGINRDPGRNRVAEHPEEQDVEYVVAGDEDGANTVTRTERTSSRTWICIVRVPRWVMYGMGSRLRSAKALIRSAPVR